MSDQCYKCDIDLRGDRMLRFQARHLCGQRSDTIVNMTEFESWAELIVINTHVQLESEPRGVDLKGLFSIAVHKAVEAATPKKMRNTRRPRSRKRSVTSAYTARPRLRPGAGGASSSSRQRHDRRDHDLLTLSLLFSNKSP